MEMVREILPGDYAMEKRNNGDEKFEFEIDHVRIEPKMINTDDAGFNREKPPVDDCCPICFGDFKLPCKANCGHWFCGGCILQLWRYRTRPLKCKCPFCSCAIHKLTPEASCVNEKGSEYVEVLDNIEEYNLFYFRGINGIFLIIWFYLRRHGPFLHSYAWRLFRALVALVVITAPTFLKKTCFELILHPDRIGTNFIRVRLIGCVLGMTWHIYHRFYPIQPGTQRFEVTKMRLFTDSVCILLVIIPYALMMLKTSLHILWLRVRIWYVRREMHAIRTQETTSREHSHALRRHEVSLEENNIALLEAVEIARKHLDTAEPESESESEADSEASSEEADAALLEAEPGFTLTTQED